MMKLFLQLRWMRQTAWLCLLLLSITGAAQAFHLHPQDARGDADKARCNLCVAGHSPQQAAATLDVVPPQAGELVIFVSNPRIPGSSRREASRIRPPPAL